MHVVAKMRHIVKNQIDFDPRLAHRYMMSIKDAIAIGIRNGLCHDWFVVQDTNKPLKLNAPTLTLGQENLEILLKFFVLAQVKIFLGVNPAWTEHGFHTGEFCKA